MAIETILLVEDDPTVLQVTARMLRQNGYTVLEASDGQDALRLVLEPLATIPDLLLTDVVMPRLGGEQLAVRLRQQYPALKVIFISGYTQEVKSREHSLGIDAPLLAKPFSMTALTGMVRAVLDA